MYLSKVFCCMKTHIFPPHIYTWRIMLPVFLTASFSHSLGRQYAFPLSAATFPTAHRCVSIHASLALKTLTLSAHPPPCSSYLPSTIFYLSATFLRHSFQHLHVSILICSHALEPQAAAIFAKSPPIVSSALHCCFPIS